MNHDNTPAPSQVREQAEPFERTRPMPLLAAAVVVIVVVVGVLYLFFSESFGSSEWGDRRSLADLSGVAPTAQAVGQADGALLFGTHCAACHQSQGQGMPGVFPPLAGSEWVTGPEQVLAAILVFGVTGEMQVKGQTYNGSMPSFARLSDSELAALATTLRTSWSNAASPVSVDTVAQVRKMQQTGPFEGGKALQAMGVATAASKPSVVSAPPVERVP